MYFVLEGHQATFRERCFPVGTPSERHPWWPSLVGTITHVQLTSNSFTTRFSLERRRVLGLPAEVTAKGEVEVDAIIDLLFAHIEELAFRLMSAALRVE